MRANVVECLVLPIVEPGPDRPGGAILADIDTDALSIERHAAEMQAAFS